MNERAVSYAIVRFQPRLGDDEFANVGVVLVDPSAGYFGYRLPVDNLARVTDFFADVDASEIRQVLVNFKIELDRVTRLVDGASSGDVSRKLEAEHAFAAVTKDRDGAIRLSNVRVAMTSDPVKKLHELFDWHVKRADKAHKYKQKRQKYRKARSNYLSKRTLTKPLGRKRAKAS